MLSKAEKIVTDLASSDPLYDDCMHKSDGTLWGKNPVCSLCNGEIPGGHERCCPWWQAYLYVTNHAHAGQLSHVLMLSLPSSLDEFGWPAFAAMVDHLNGLSARIRECSAQDGGMLGRRLHAAAIHLDAAAKELLATGIEDAPLQDAKRTYVPPHKEETRDDDSHDQTKR